MRAGSLTERVILLEPIRRDDMPGAKVEWREHKPRYAEYRPGSTSRVLSADENFGLHKAVFLIRNFAPPAAGWRLQHVGGQLYKIIAEPDINRHKGFMTLICENVNL